MATRRVTLSDPNSKFFVNEIQHDERHGLKWRLIEEWEPENIGMPEFTQVGSDEKLHVGIVTDVETTSLDIDEAEIIELGAVKFTFTSDCRVVKVIDTLHMYNQPKRVIVPEITHITGITNEMVKGHKLDQPKVVEFFDGARITVAHNAEYDRNVIEKQIPDMEQDRLWTCSHKDIPWKEKYGLGSSKLDYLAFLCGFSFPAHRATNDCFATLRILATKAPEGHQFLKEMVRWATKPKFRCDAVKSAFAKKELLKRAGYHWDGDRKVWSKVLAGEDRETETAFLEESIYEGSSRATFTKIELLQAHRKAQ